MARWLALQGRHQPAEMAGPMPGRQILGDPILERDQPDRIALHRQEIGDGRRSRARIFTLGIRAGAVAHRPAHVEYEIATEVGLVFEPFDVIAIGARKQAPVEISRVVAGAILAVFAEFYREAMIGAAMDSFDESLDGNFRPDLEALDAHQGTGIDERGSRRRQGGRRLVASPRCGIRLSRTSKCEHQAPGPLTCSSSRSITASTVTPSASAR